MSACEKPSNGRYSSGCRCDACKAAKAAYVMRYTYRKALGVPSSFVDAEPVRAHIDRLKAAGMSNREICRAAAISNGTLTNIVYRHWRTGKPVRRVTRTTADRILAVNRRAYSKGQQVPREAMDRRIVEMLAEGYSVNAMCRITGMDRQVIDRWKDRTARTVSAANLLRFMRATDAQLGEWLCEDNKSAITRAKNTAKQAAVVIGNKWGADQNAITVERVDDGRVLRKGGREVAIEIARRSSGAALRVRVPGNSQQTVYTVNGERFVGLQAAQEYAHDLLSA